MGFRVANESSSSFNFETDLPATVRNIHPSGVLHAFRCAPPSAGNGGIGREEHAFAWITNSIHVEAALSRFEENGFDRETGMVYIPYSSKRNWAEQYPHAEPALEFDEDGTCVALKSLGTEASEIDKEENDKEEHDKEDGNAAATVEAKRRRRFYGINMLKDNSFLPDAERDELHIEIYNYLSWLHSKLVEVDRKAAEEEQEAESMEGETKAASAEGGTNEGEINEEKKESWVKSRRGVDVPELKGVLDKLESTFLIIPNIKAEKAREERQKQQQQQQQQQHKDPQPREETGEDQPPQKQPDSQHGEEEKEERGPRKRPRPSPNQRQEERRKQRQTAPLLERAISDHLIRVVEARAGKRRSRQKQRERKTAPDSNRRNRPLVQDFDMMFERLARYREEHGATAVPKNYQDQQLANWVRGIRERKAKLVKQDLEVEAIAPGEPLPAKALTAERVAKLESIDFTWAVNPPKVAWEDRFEELMEYYEAHGRWPSQAKTGLGRWVHKQRGEYAKKNANYMKYKAPKLDEVGFEWTPRGNTRMTWDEGLELLMEYGRINGHYVVPEPVGDEDTGEVDRKSQEYRLYKWVQSLHNMYRSYALGRQSGSLTEERVALLTKHGFLFRPSHT